MQDKIPGKHSFDGACRPGQTPFRFTTFSVGIFQWVVGASGNIKRGRSIVRVRGYTDRPDEVMAKAQEIVEQLDFGSYQGPKHVSLLD